MNTSRPPVIGSVVTLLLLIAAVYLYRSNRVLYEEMVAARIEYEASYDSSKGQRYDAAAENYYEDGSILLFWVCVCGIVVTGMSTVGMSWWKQRSHAFRNAASSDNS